MGKIWDHKGRGEGGPIGRIGRRGRGGGMRGGVARRLAPDITEWRSSNEGRKGYRRGGGAVEL